MLKDRLIDEIDDIEWEDKHYERRKGDTPATKKAKHNFAVHSNIATYNYLNLINPFHFSPKCVSLHTVSTWHEEMKLLIHTCAGKRELVH